MSNKKWMQRYVFTYLHEIFFGEFPKIMTEWLGRVLEKIGRFSVATSKNLTRELVRQMNSISNPPNRAVHFWLDSVLGDYLIEFVLDCIQS
jgi:hypothetical protein